MLIVYVEFRDMCDHIGQVEVYTRSDIGFICRPITGNVTSEHLSIAEEGSTYESESGALGLLLATEFETMIGVSEETGRVRHLDSLFAALQ